MQHKMAGSSRLAQAFYRAYFSLWIPLLARAATSWPPALMYWIARWLVIVPFGLLRPKYGRAVRGNLGRVLALPSDHPAVRRSARRMMFEHAYHWIDFFRWSQLPVERLVANLAAVDGEEHFAAVRASGRGTVLITAHMGNPEVGGIGIGKQFAPVHVLYWRDRFAPAEEFRTRMRRLGNVSGIPVDASPLSAVPALRVLREGGIVAAHADRDFNDQGWSFDFFGAPAKFPPGPFLLAERAGALLLPSFFLVAADRRFRVEFEEPIDLTGEGERDARIRAAMARWVSLLERQVRAHPAQWYTFYPFWGQRQGTGDRGLGTATTTCDAGPLPC
jgi:KDO2-lipid IV(A) lauroyltransferase